MWEQWPKHPPFKEMVGCIKSHADVGGTERESMNCGNDGRLEEGGLGWWKGGLMGPAGRQLNPKTLFMLGRLHRHGGRYKGLD